MKVGDIVKYNGQTYEVGQVKTNSKGVWIQFKDSPTFPEATSCTGIMAECWFSEDSVKIKTIQE